MRHPIQPIEEIEGIHRFKQNKIIRDLLDFGQARGFGLNEIACGGYSAEDHQQLAQLIGYSLSGYGSLSYVDNAAYETAHAMLHAGKSEQQVRIEYLEGLVSMLKEKLREPVAALFEIHPDDLGEA